MPAGVYQIVFSIVDAAGHRSNEIPATVTIQPQLPRGAGLPQLPASPFVDRLGPAR